MTRRVVVFAIDLFKRSEVFITEQAAAHSWAVTFVGESLAGTPPAGAHYLLGSRRPTTLRELERLAPDIVHAHFGVGIPAGARLSKSLGLPLVATLHGFDVTRRRSSLILSGRPNLLRYGATRRRVLRTPDRTFAVSKFIRDAALRSGARSDRTFVHHIGTALHGLPTPEGHRWESGRPMRIAHVARLVEKKGTLVLLNALAGSRAAMGGDFTLRVVGDGPQRAALEAAAQRLGLTSNVQFLGTQSHETALRVIADADVLCLPSVVARNGDAEGLGMVLLEAASLGTPVIATSSGGITDFVEANITGLVVPPDDADALGLAFIELSQAPELASRLATEAKSRVSREFDIDTQTARLEESFEDVITARPDRR